MMLTETPEPKIEYANEEAYTFLEELKKELISNVRLEATAMYIWELTNGVSSNSRTNQLIAEIAEYASLGLAPFYLLIPKALDIKIRYDLWYRINEDSKVDIEVVYQKRTQRKNIVCTNLQHLFPDIKNYIPSTPPSLSPSHTWWERISYPTACTRS